MTPFDDPIAGFRRSILVWGEESPSGAIRWLPSGSTLAEAPGHAEVLIAPSILLDSVAVAAWRPSSALVVLTGPGRGFISSAERDRLWKLFRVPCFERLLDADGTVVASECEAHNGMHLMDSSDEWELQDDVLRRAGQPVACVTESRQETCGCGHHGRKIFGVRPAVTCYAA